MFFNQRLFYLAARETIGYLKQVPAPDQPLEEVDFSVSKGTVCLSEVKNVHMHEKEMRVVYSVEDEKTHKKVEKQWLFRMKTDLLVDRWHSLLHSILKQTKQKKN